MASEQAVTSVVSRSDHGIATRRVNQTRAALYTRAPPGCFVACFFDSAMAKDKGAAAAKPGAQKPISSFFGGSGSKKKAPPKAKSDDSDFEMKDEELVVSDDASDADVDVVSEEEEEEEAPKKKGRARAAPKAPKKSTKARAAGDEDEDDAEGGDSTNTWQANLPPIHNISDIFSDIVRREPRFKDVAERVRGRKLRVATMCSGTESPLLALDMMCRFVEEQHGVPLEVEHVFSCEIEPFKQAYIERNFQPPLLFRDVCELGQSHA
jgi:hypothetical protein